jgi:hypothetical protein
VNRYLLFVCAWLALSAVAPAQQTATAGISAASGFAAEPRAFIGPLPAPAAGGLNARPIEPYPQNIYLAPWSRMSVGADVSPLGIGIKGTIDMNTFMDLRGNFDFFHFNPGRFEIEGFNTYGHLNLSSAAAMFDTYPWNSVWRLSAGVMLINNNQLSGTVDVAPGTSFSLDHQTFWSATTNPATGATPLTGGGTLGFHRNNPALIVSGGFGKFIPRSQRHWSFPSEFGVIFTGAPTLNTHQSGWACLDKAQTECANLSDSGNPVTVEFNNSLNSAIAKWRRSLAAVPVYPVFTYSVVYSFDIRH